MNTLTLLTIKNNKTIVNRITICFAALLLFSASVYSQSITGSKHNLSVSGTGYYVSTTETSICIFCHMPSNCTSNTPLSNRYQSVVSYVLYNSPTFDATTINQPGGSSQLCLACHDGSQLLGHVKSSPYDIFSPGNSTYLPAAFENLSIHHPVSFIYNNTLSVVDGGLYDPNTHASGLGGTVASDMLENNKVQCTSCHDIHNKYGFPYQLKKNNSGSALCLTCHVSLITGSAHDFSYMAWNTTGEICIVCHAPHNTAMIADAPLWNHQISVVSYTLYTSPTFDATTSIAQPDGSTKLCLSCHDGTVALESFGANPPVGTNYASYNFGTDVSNDHPVSFTYNTALAMEDGGLWDPSTHSSGIGSTINTNMLFNGNVQCASCHDVHNSTGLPHLLIKSNAGSGLCLTCHNSNINGSVHDFATYPWNTTGEICIVCHAPHNTAMIADAPLWNHQTSAVIYYTLYTSPTFDATTSIAQPDGSTKLCLSCHDGTVALESFGANPPVGTNYASYNFGTDVSNDHPVSFVYNSALANADSGLWDPSTHNSGIGSTINANMLFNGKLQCASCHFVHNSTGLPDLLVKSNAGSGLCLTCHNFNIYGSVHDLLMTPWNTTGEICIVCHASHNTAIIPDAPLWNHQTSAVINYTLYASPTFNGAVSISQPSGSTKLCLSCHDGTVALESFISNGATTTTYVSGIANFGTDLSNDHPVSFVYNTSLANADSGLRDPSIYSSGLGSTITTDLLYNGQMQCASCHNTHGNNNPLSLHSSNTSSLCMTCHNYGQHYGMVCTDCHQAHNALNPNKFLIKNKISTPNNGIKNVVFTAVTGINSYADGDAAYDGICEVCHTQASTAYHRDNATGDHNHHKGSDCSTCHKHANNFKAP